MAEQHLPGAHVHGGSPVDNPEVRHEESDVNIRGILMFAAGLIVVAFVVHVAMWGLYRFFDARENHRQGVAEYPLAAQQEQRLPPEPRLQTNPREDMQKLRDGEEQILTTYGWVDKNAGVVRIPIDEAMKLTVQRGLPARK
jgi:hypothetical protein